MSQTPYSAATVYPHGIEKKSGPRAVCALSSGPLAALSAERLSDAIDQGADLIYGHDRRGALYSPTVLDNVPRDAELVVEETFGPPIPIIRVNLSMAHMGQE